MAGLTKHMFMFFPPYFCEDLSARMLVFVFYLVLLLWRAIRRTARLVLKQARREEGAARKVQSTPHPILGGGGEEVCAVVLPHSI